MNFTWRFWPTGMKREFSVDAKFGAPQVAYRETIGQSVEVEYIHREAGGAAASSLG